MCMFKKSKYRAVKTNGYASKKESKRAQELALMAAGGLITNLMEQVSYQLIPSQRNAFGKAERPCKYIADFVYIQDGKQVVEDVKGQRLPEYIIKRKLMLMIHGITILET
jgi:uncharacterized protein YejL (UPF0352 family)